MLFLSLFLFAVENLVRKDMGLLNLNSVPDSSASSASASPARGTHYTAWLQKKPPALSLVAHRANSEKQAKKLLAQVGNADNFSGLQKINWLDSQIDIAEHGKFTIMDSKIINGKFDGYYRVQDDKSKIYKLFVQNVSNLGILKSFMAELLKAYIGKDFLFTEVPKVDDALSVSVTSSHQLNLGESPQGRRRNSDIPTVSQMTTDKKEDCEPDGAVVGATHIDPNLESVFVTRTKQLIKEEEGENIQVNKFTLSPFMEKKENDEKNDEENDDDWNWFGGDTRNIVIAVFCATTSFILLKKWFSKK